MFTKSFTRKLVERYGEDWDYGNAWELALTTGLSQLYRTDLLALAKLAGVSRRYKMSNNLLVLILLTK